LIAVEGEDLGRAGAWCAEEPRELKWLAEWLAEDEPPE
jgi:hypothetical protein